MQASILHAKPLACPARVHAPRPKCRRVAIHASQPSYISPSSRTASTELEVLERFSVVVPDVLLSQNLQDVEAPKAATVSRSVLVGILSSPTGLRRYKVRWARRPRSS